MAPSQVEGWGGPGQARLHENRAAGVEMQADDRLHGKSLIGAPFLEMCPLSSQIGLPEGLRSQSQYQCWVTLFPLHFVALDRLHRQTDDPGFTFPPSERRVVVD